MHTITRLAALLLATTALAHAETFPIFEDASGAVKANNITKAGGTAKTLIVSATSNAYINFSVSYRQSAADFIDPATVTAARLVLFLPTTSAKGTLSIKRLTSSFTESIVKPIAAPTISAGPAIDTIDLAQTPLKGDYYIVDVTSQVIAWLNDPANEFGIAITSDGTAKATLASKEGAGSGHPAFIEVDIRGSGAGSTLQVNGILNLGTTLDANNGAIFQGGVPLLHTYGIDNFFAGSNAGNFTLGPEGFSLPKGNTGVGTNVLQSVTSGFNNTAMGKLALQKNTKGSYNTALGANALGSNTEGSDNTAIGYSALPANVNGSNNAAFHEGALNNNIDGSNNTAIGRDSLFNNITGSSNTALGKGAGYNITGNDNIAIGNEGIANESGVIRLGTPGTHVTTFLSGVVQSELGLILKSTVQNNNRILLNGAEYFQGVSSGAGVALRLGVNRDDNRQLWIADSTAAINNTNAQIRILVGGNGVVPEISSFSTDGGTGRPLVINGSGGDVGIGKVAAGFKLDVNGGIRCNGAVNTTSDARYKTHIAPLSGALDTVLRLRGVSYDWRRDEFPAMAFSDQPQLGFVAQEVREVLPQIVSEDTEGMLSIGYSAVTPVLVEAIKEQHSEVQKLRAENAVLKKDSEDLRKRLERLEALIAK